MESRKLSTRVRNLALNSVVFALNAIATKLISFILLPLYTAHLTAAEFGLTDMSLTVISLVFPLATLSLVEAAVRYMISDRRDADEYAVISFSFVLISILLVVIASPLLDLPAFGGLGKYKSLFFLAYASSAFLSYFGEVARGAGEIKIIPICATLSSLTTLGITLYSINSGEYGIEDYFISVSMGPVLASAVYLMFGGFLKKLKAGYVKLVKDLSHGRSMLCQMLRYSLPLVPNSLFWWMGTSISRFFITGILGISATGLYAAAGKIPNLLNALYSVFLQAWQLSVFEENDEKAKCDFFESVFAVLQAVMLIGCSLMALAAPALAYVLIKGEAYKAWPLIGVMLISAVGNIFSSFYGTVFTSTMNTSCIMTTTAKGSLCCVVLTPILTTSLGLSGACIASALTQILVLVSRMRRARMLVPFDQRLRYLIPSMLLLAIQASVMIIDFDKLWIPSVICLFFIVMLQFRSLLKMTSNCKKSLSIKAR